MATGIRGTGEFCWINMLTPQPAEARAFFGQLLGWTYFEMPGLGHGMQVGGRNIGGLFDLEGPNTPPGLSPHIGVMVKVETTDALCEKVASLGGKANPAFDIMQQGRMAVCFDPIGAEFDVWEPRKMLGTEVDSTLHGAPSWFEMRTTDFDRAEQFYTELFGWEAEAMEGQGVSYATFKIGDKPVAGMTQVTPEMVNLRPHWATYFTVMDAEATAREAVRLGTRVHVPLQDVRGIGTFCGITSPQGVKFHVIKYIH